ncbi:MAG: hypothetical protein PF436_07205 [Prolixibacteraceae bacterium]|jgi:hypothetical protein|nr:hypothetical protein [Prolixibacteraceae bacterium]
MGFIKEPEGVDFVIQSKPLTEKQEKELSEFIAKRKLEIKKKSKNGTYTHNIKQLGFSGLRGFGSRFSILVGGQERIPKTQPFHIVKRWTTC